MFGDDEEGEASSATGLVDFWDFVIFIRKCHRIRWIFNTTGLFAYAAHRPRSKGKAGGDISCIDANNHKKIYNLLSAAKCTESLPFPNCLNAKGICHISMLLIRHEINITKIASVHIIQ